VLVEQARRIETSSSDSVAEVADRADLTRDYEAVLAARVAADASSGS
jgi:hypothetical protein